MKNSFRFHKLLNISLFVTLLLILSPNLFCQEDQPIIQRIDCKNLKESAQIQILSTPTKVNFITYELSSPDRIVIDFVDSIFSNIPRTYFFKEGIITSIELMASLGISQEPLDESFYPVDFIVITLRQPIKYVLNQQNDTLLIAELGDFEKEFQLASVKPAEITVAPKEPPKEEIPQEKKEERIVETKVGQAKEEIEAKRGEEEILQKELSEIPAPIEEGQKEEGQKEEGQKPLASSEIKDEEKLNILVDVEPAQQKIEEPAKLKAGEPAKESLPQPTALHRETISTQGIETQEGEPFNLLNNLECKNLPNSAKIKFISDKPIDPTVYETEDPLEFFVDTSIRLFSNVGTDIKFDEGIVSSIRVIKKDASLPKELGQECYPVDFMVISLNKPARYEVMRNQDEVAINFKAISEEAGITKKETGPAPKEAGLMPKEEAGPASKEEIYKETPIITLPAVEAALIACVQVGLSNNRLAKITKEEIELARLRLRDARRGLFPTATLKSSWTKGSNAVTAVNSVGYVEKFYGVEISHPLYYGGKLVNTFKQAKISLEMSMKKYDKIEADITLEVSQNYYDLVTTKTNLRLQQELAGQIKPLLDDAKARLGKDLITEIDYMNIEALYNQVLLQVDTAKKDVDLAKLKLRHVLDLKSIDSLEIPSAIELDYINREINLDEAFKLALDNRPEVFMDRLLVDFNKYEELIAKSKDDFKIDFTGSYGKSGDAYTDDKFKRRLDWYAGFKLTKPFFGNTLGYSWTKNSTSAKLGQSTRTHGRTDTVEMNVLNTLSNATEIEQAHVGYLKAVNEFNETVKSVETEVQEAYNTYEKAILQVENEREKIKVKERQLKITEFETSLNESTLTQLIEAKIKLVDERASYVQAISSYKTAVAKLNKAIGISGYYR